MRARFRWWSVIVYVAATVIACGDSARPHSATVPGIRDTYDLDGTTVRAIHLGDFQVTNVELLGVSQGTDPDNSDRSASVVYVGFTARDRDGATWIALCEIAGVPPTQWSGLMDSNWRARAALRCSYHIADRIDAISWRAHLVANGTSSFVSARDVSGEMQPSNYEDNASVAGIDTVRSRLEVGGSGHDWRMTRRVRTSSVPPGSTHATTQDAVAPGVVGGVQFSPDATSYTDPGLSPQLTTAANLIIATALVLHGPLTRSHPSSGGEATGSTPPRATQISVSPTHICARFDNGSVRCRGRRDTVDPHITGAVSVAAGGNYACAILADATITCWWMGTEYDHYGAMGVPGAHAQGVPLSVYGVSPVTQLSLEMTVDNPEHTCALLRDGSVRCWGRNEQWFDGLATTAAVKLPDASNVAQIEIGGRPCDGLAARLTDGTIRTLVHPHDRNCNLDDDHSVQSYVSHAAALHGVAHLSIGESFTCAAMADGTVRCWGDNDNGQAGANHSGAHGRPGFVSAPTAVTGVHGASDVVANWRSACALAHGSVLCWGEGDDGQLGDGTDHARGEAAPVQGLTDAVQIAGAAYLTCALRATGAIVCWGRSDALPSTVRVPTEVQL